MLGSKYDIDNRDAIMMYRSRSSLPAALEGWKELSSLRIFRRLREIHTSGPRQARRVSEADSGPTAFLVSSRYYLGCWRIEHVYMKIILYKCLCLQ